VLGHHEQALSYGRQALDLADPIDAPELAAATLDTLAYAHRHLGHHDTAIRYYQRVIELRHAVGDTLYEAKALLALGGTHRDAADPAAARAAWQRSLPLLDALHHPDATEARTRLHDLDT
jgi:tetratricopeptide (TPR) repeat protein